jgi:hypothetical protein
VRRCVILKLPIGTVKRGMASEFLKGIAKMGTIGKAETICYIRNGSFAFDKISTAFNFHTKHILVRADAQCALEEPRKMKYAQVTACRQFLKRYSPVNRRPYKLNDFSELVTGQLSL